LEISVGVGGAALCHERRPSGKRHSRRPASGARERAAAPSCFAPFATAAVHPSSLLREPDEETRRRELELFIADMKNIAEVLRTA